MIKTINNLTQTTTGTCSDKNKSNPIAFGLNVVNKKDSQQLLYFVTCMRNNFQLQLYTAKSHNRLHKAGASPEH